ncbi:unnamed protein product [Blepharisma stoltei]|uniref:EF-hand domain-containing protein n=1 Tax=Blepharisma stoltei TaxID=1481888 RepID=A0AAU9JB05_9CILI|nr:unnamed protein product [Blepharisma stoltei]
MELILDQQAVAIIRQAFQCCDIDGDGFISKNDLKISSGIEDESDIEKIFFAIKDSTDNNPITFEEFKKGIMDFPFLLEQFKQEYTEKPKKNKVNVPKLVIKIDEAEEEYISTRDSPTFMLQNVFTYFQNAVREFSEQISAPEPSGISRRSDSLDECRRLLNNLLRKPELRQPNPQISVVNGALSLLDYIESEKSKFQNQLEHLQNEINDKKIALKNSEVNNERLKTRNEELLENLSKLESENSRRYEDHITAVKEKKLLQNQLRNNEAKAKMEIGNIQNVIAEKEKAIKNLEKEINRLRSFKTLQELTYHKDFSPDQVRKNRISTYTPRNVMTFVSPIGSPKYTKKQKKFNLDVIAPNELERKTKEFREKEIVYIGQIDKLTKELSAMKEKEENKNFPSNSQRNSSLHEDLELLKDIPGIDAFSLNSSKNPNTPTYVIDEDQKIKKRRCCGLFW